MHSAVAVFSVGDNRDTCGQQRLHTGQVPFKCGRVKRIIFVRGPTIYFGSMFYKHTERFTVAALSTVIEGTEVLVIRGLQISAIVDQKAQTVQMGMRTGRDLPRVFCLCCGELFRQCKRLNKIDRQLWLLVAGIPAGLHQRSATLWTGATVDIGPRRQQ